MKKILILAIISPLLLPAFSISIPEIKTLNLSFAESRHVRAETPFTETPLDLSAYEFIQKIFSENLTDLQREELWKEYKGRPVRWTAMVEDISSTNSGIVGYFYVPLANPYYDLVIVEFDESQKKTLLELGPRDLVAFEGVIKGTKPVLGRNLAVVIEKGKIIGKVLIPVWTKIIELKDLVYSIIDAMCNDTIYFWRQWYGRFYEPVIAVDANTGQILWVSKEIVTVPKEQLEKQQLIGFDAQNIYFLNVIYRSEGEGTNRKVYEQGIVSALDRQTGKISNELLIYKVEKSPKKEESPMIDEIRAILAEGGIKFIQHYAFGQKVTLLDKIDILGEFAGGLDRIGTYYGRVLALDSNSQRVLWVWHAPFQFKYNKLGAKGNLLYFVNFLFDNLELRAYKVNIPALSLNQPPTCVIKLQKGGVEIDEVGVGEFFDIYAGNSTDDTGIREVRFSSDDAQDGVPTGEWTQWYKWNVSSGDWDAITKIKRWSFVTSGAKEVWAEVRDEADQTAKCSANIYVVEKTLPEKAAELAKSVVGATYQWGAKGYCWDKRRFVDSEEILNTGYGWNWKNPSEYGTGLDCSGLVFWSYNKAAGVQKYRDSLVPEGAQGQWEACIKIDKTELKQGDLLFFDEYPVGDGKMDHVAIYVGPFNYEGNIYNVVHASGFANKVVPAYYDSEREVLITVKATGEKQSIDVDGYGRVKGDTSPVKMKIIAKSPVDLIVTDPENITVSKEADESPGMFYVEIDINGDGKLDDVINIWERKMGDYWIKVVPESNTSLSDTYTLEVFSDGITITLAENVRITDIPTKPYMVKSKKTEILPRYYLEIISEYGDPQGEGWYDAGATATFSITSPIGIIIRQVFIGWSGDYTGTETTGTILMDKPKKIIAHWHTDYAQLYVLLGVILAIGTLIFYIKRRK